MESIKEMSKTYQYRKVMKPMLERKRRARINKCLDELKVLMIETMRQEGGDSVSRLEKADILELTVQHLRKLKTTNDCSTSSDKDLSKIDSFRAGYVNAANEVSRCLATLPKIDIGLGTTLMTHLGHRLNQIQDNLKLQYHQQQRQSVITTMHPSKSTSCSVPLTVNCENKLHSQQLYHSGMLSPASSGYGSDIENSTSLDLTTKESYIMKKFNQDQELQKNVWRPW